MSEFFDQNEDLKEFFSRFDQQDPVTYGDLNNFLTKWKKVKQIYRKYDCHFCWEISDEIFFSTSKDEKKIIPKYIIDGINNIKFG